MNAARFVIKNMAQFRRDMDAEDKRRIKAAETAAKVEGYRLMKKLKAELKQGRAGGRSLTPLSIIARKMRTTKARRRTIRKPLSRMSVPIRYRTVTRHGRTLVQIGLVDPNYGAKLSKKWVWLGFVLQEGRRVEISEKQKKNIRDRGAQLARSQDPAARFFFMRRSTKTVQEPARPFIEPFFNANRRQAGINIVNNFERKMQGERI